MITVLAIILHKGSDDHSISNIPIQGPALRHGTFACRYV